MREFNQKSDRRGSRSGERPFGRSDRRDSRSGERPFGRSDRRDSGRPNRDSEQRTMHEVTCDECGNRCEVPFKPIEGKPVYCNDCFRKNKNSGSENKPDQFKKEFDQINRKLDEILKKIDMD